MNYILLSGGSGQRLWPLSNDSRSKQFLKVLEDDDGNSISMVQRVWKQLNENEMTSSTVVATSKSQSDILKNQLGSDVNLVIEPQRRDTFPAIVLAASYLYSEGKKDLEEIVTVLPVDPFVESDFFMRVKELEEALRINDADLALLGVTPTYPSEKYGYIIPQNSETVFNIKSFREKPNKKNAEIFIKENALWNCGVFSFKLSFLKEVLNNYNLEFDYSFLKENYSLLPKISFDYEVVEKTTNIIGVKYDGEWKDLGTWNTLAEEVSSNFLGEGVISDSVNTNVINELNIPVAVIGVDNAIVVSSPDGILVSSKDDSYKVKNVVAHLEKWPKYEEKSWGTKQILDHNYSEEEMILVNKIIIFNKKNTPLQLNTFENTMLNVVSGKGTLIKNSEIIEISVGDSIRLNNNDYYSIKSDYDLEIIEISRTFNFFDEAVNPLIVEDWKEIVGSLIHNIT